jgi:hypothetical protein
MNILKGLISKRDQQKTVTRQDNDVVPHLVPKYGRHKKSNIPTLKPLRRIIPIERFASSELPDIVLRPPTPPPGEINVEDLLFSGMKVEDILFERSGSVFILREPRVHTQCKSTSRSVVGHLKVPARHRTATRHDKDAVASRRDKGVEESESCEVDLDDASQDDYRTFVNGLFGI